MTQPAQQPATGRSYLDPVYDQYETSAANQVGIDASVLRAIRTQGERSNADQVSTAGARTVYQIIPQTRAGLMKNYGIDPYSSPQNAALGAALLMREGLARNNGNLDAAIGEYHGGTDRRMWGPVNAAYRARAMGALSPSMQQSVAPGARQYNVLRPDAQADDNALMASGGPALSPVKIPKPDVTPDAFASAYQPASTSPAQLASNARTGADGTPDWNGWLDSYIRSVLNNV